MLHGKILDHPWMDIRIIKQRIGYIFIFKIVSWISKAGHKQSNVLNKHDLSTTLVYWAMFHSWKVWEKAWWFLVCQKMCSQTICFTSSFIVCVCKVKQTTRFNKACLSSSLIVFHQHKSSFLSYYRKNLKPC